LRVELRQDTARPRNWQYIRIAPSPSGIKAVSPLFTIEQAGPEALSFPHCILEDQQARRQKHDIEGAQELNPERQIG
jgi:hypothetical protein